MCFVLMWATIFIEKVPVKSGGHTKWMFDVWTVVLHECCRHSRTASEPQHFVTVVSEVRDKMATTRSQAARDAAPETTTERKRIETTDNMMAFLQQIVSHQTEERRARENDKEKREERERERQKREQERFEVLKETVGKKLVQFSGRIDEVKEDNDGGQQQEGNEEREEEGGEMSHEKEGAEETDQLQEERERAVQEQKSQQEAESKKGRSHMRRIGRRGGYVSQPRRRRSDKCLRR